MIAVIISKAMYSLKECIAFLFVYKYKIAVEKVSTNKHKAKGLGQAFFPKGLRVSRGQSHLVAVRRQRNLFADGQSN